MTNLYPDNRQKQQRTKSNLPTICWGEPITTVQHVYTKKCMTLSHERMIKRGIEEMQWNEQFHLQVIANRK